MRAVKFRAWDTHFEKMGTVLLLALGDGREHQTLVRFDDGTERYVHKKNMKLREYTGLKDKNDKKIYKHDIVEWYADGSVQWKGPVEYGRFLAGDHLEVGVWVTGWYVGPLAEEGITEELHVGYKVIGNIYENPELLKDGKS